MADHGYQPYMGGREVFVSGFREGYQAGYEAGFNGQRPAWDQVYGLQGYNPEQAPPPPPPPPAPPAGQAVPAPQGSQDLAYDMGYRDGLFIGEHDARDGRPFRPDKNHLYNDAGHGYMKAYGERAAYRETYRQAFLKGYQDGYGKWQ
jgi:hypothetical protein